jgi:phage terminase large subunit-like protein
MSDLLDAVRAMTPAEWAEVSKVLLAWFPTGRPEQKPDPDLDWLIFAYVAGRGAGKTRSGAEWIAEQALGQPGTRWAIVAPTFADVRDTCVEGESGLGTVLRRRIPGLDWGKAWNRTLLEVTLPNGSRIKGFSAEEPERLRGPQHHGAWADELAAWKYHDAWDQLQFGLRLGACPRTFVTTTPKPTKTVRALFNRAAKGAGVMLVGGSTFDNADNLSAAALTELREQYEGTRLGRQELYGELLLDTPGALWTQQMIDGPRVTTVPTLRRVVIAIDPAVTSGEDSDSTGIVAAGIGLDGHLYVLHDWTCKESPERWARRAVELYDTVGGDRIVAEVNNGGDLVEAVLRTVDPSVPVRKVHASRGKRMRAEPVAALYEQGKVHHVGGLPELEDQMTTWTPESGESPDRLDALVWALTDLAVEPAHRRRRSIVGMSAA